MSCDFEIPAPFAFLRIGASKHDGIWDIILELSVSRISTSWLIFCLFILNFDFLTSIGESVILKQLCAFAFLRIGAGKLAGIWAMDLHFLNLYFYLAVDLGLG